MVQRPILVLVHGLVGSFEYFDPSARIAHAQAHACDLLGYGRWRETPADQLTLSTQVEHVARFVESVSSEPVWLLGHSMGGAVAMLLADCHPKLVAGIINVEGNFTLVDAFWSSRITAMSLQDWEQEYATITSNVAGWLKENGIAPTARNLEWGRHVAGRQPAGTLHAMSQSLVEETGKPSYLEAVRRVIDRSVPIHLIAGERSAADWDVPDFVRRVACSYTEVPDTGHFMMLEDPDEFCRIADRCLGLRPA